MILKNKQILIYGYGKSGKSAAKLALLKGASVSIYDDCGEINELPKGAEYVSDFASAADDADMVVISPSIPFDLPILDKVRADGKKVIGELEFAYSFCDCGIIAVSGTNGKTTTTLLLSEIIKNAGRNAEAVGNIGIPFSERVLSLSQSDTAVIEVSSFQLESSYHFSPDISVLLNITPDHLDRHRNLSEYIAAKGRLFKNQINKDYAVLNADDSLVMQVSEYIQPEKYYFSTTKKVKGSYLEDGKLYFEDAGKIFIADSAECALKGRYNIENMLAASTAAILNGVAPEIIRKTLKTFCAPEYRNMFLGEKFGKKFFNDSKGTNIAATVASLETMVGDTVLIMGGSDKGEIFADFFKSLPKNVVHIFVTGLNSPKIIENAINAGYYNISYRNSLLDCVRESACIHTNNILFSPASASFDQYRDYRQRGEVFTKIFEELK